MNVYSDPQIRAAGAQAKLNVLDDSKNDAIGKLVRKEFCTASQSRLDLDHAPMRPYVLYGLNILTQYPSRPVAGHCDGDWPRTRPIPPVQKFALGCNYCCVWQANTDNVNPEQAGRVSRCERPEDESGHDE